MGIESEQLVYDYLSRVGDLAQQGGLPSGDRMRLVAELRADIDRRRASAGTDSPAGVKRILAKLGTPADVVAAAGGRPPAGGAPDGGAAGPGSAGGTYGSGGPSRGAYGTGEPRGAYGSGEPPRGTGAAGMARAAREKLSGLAERSGLTGKVPTPRDGDAPAGRPGAPGESSSTGAPPAGASPGQPAAGHGNPPRVPSPARRSPSAASPPHLAGEDELGPRESNPDWWHVEPGPFAQPEQRDSPFGQVEGFTGGIEIPELLGMPTEADQEKDAKEAAGADPDQDAGAGAADGGGKEARRPGLLRRALRRRRGGDAEAAAEGAERTGSLSPLLLLAAALLVAGAVLGNLIVMAFGWVLAYSTRKLSRAEAKWAALGMPGLVAAVAMAWLWGRATGKWGEPIPQDGMKDALRAAWPVVVRSAAIASALFLVWRARRRT
ncbi:hypothetical protein ABZ553_16600 [Streptomyces sparsogenes]|uniref:hypothetical protein n=1 Tax=Streptomyces sparsogenes TaxID=67365 RepID=UPI0033F0805A